MDIILNERQNEAATHKDGAMLVLAGPGSGKTTVIIQRVKNLIENYLINPCKILVISFTRASAEEMRKRFDTLTYGKYKVNFSTFHSFFFRVIRVVMEDTPEKNSVLNDGDKKRIISEIISRAGIVVESVDNIINDISLVKNELMRSEDFFCTECSNDDFVKIYNLYDKYKKDNNVIDFDDMLEMCYRIFTQNKDALKYWQNRYSYILIDEFQDINRAQYEIIKLLGKAENNVFAVGDDDQSIYGFRGARPEFMLEFPKDFENTRQVTLNINYRSTDEIIKLSNTVISENKKRYEKNIVGTKRTGKKPTVLKFENIEAEADGIADKILKMYSQGTQLHEIAVIYRTNSQSRALVDAFMKKNIPYQLKDSALNIYEHWIMRDITSYIRLAENTYDDEAFKNIANKPSRYLKREYISEALNDGKNEALIYKMLKFKNLAPYQRERIDDLLYQLKILVKKKPADAINYIRKTIGYDEYIKSYSQFTKISEEGLKAIINEITAAAEPFDSFNDFFEHTERYTKETKENTNTVKAIENGKAVLTTMHSAKGLEFDVVFVASAVNGIIPYMYARSVDEMEEERRLFYVALTRARNLLYVSFIYSRYSQETTPTIFLKKFMPKKRRENNK